MTTQPAHSLGDLRGHQIYVAGVPLPQDLWQAGLTPAQLWAELLDLLEQQPANVELHVQLDRVAALAGSAYLLNTCQARVEHLGGTDHQELQQGVSLDLEMAYNSVHGIAGQLLSEVYRRYMRPGN